jgi:D-arginine dehydrogenase
MTACDFLVIGAGIAGASIACELALEASVVVAEQEDRAGYHTSGRSAAMYIRSYGAPPVRALTAASRAFFDDPPAGFTDYPLLAPRACLTIARQDQAAALDSLADQIRAAGEGFSELTTAEARALLPVLRAASAHRAILEPDCADIDVDALHQGFLRLGRARGVELRLAAKVSSITRRSDHWQVRFRDGGEVEARVVINAAGAWADEVAELAGARRIGVTPKRRTVILIEPPAGAEIASWPTVLDVAEQFYFKPQSGLILASPGDETPVQPQDAAPDEYDIAVCVDRIQQAAELPVRRVNRAWAGLRTFTADKVQAFGYDADGAGFFWFAGQGGFGMQTSPAAARLGAALALRRPVPEDLAGAGVRAADYAPARFS